MPDRIMFYGASANVFRKAYILRISMTRAEKHLWDRLRKSMLEGFRFRAQHPIDAFVVDFYCHQAKLVVEIDEKYHFNPAQRLEDENRDYVIKEFGLTVLRFTDDQVLTDVQSVVQTIRQHLPKKT